MGALDEGRLAELEAAARAATEPRESLLCECSEEEADQWFDRSICPEPCGMMHYHCSTCLHGVDRCVLKEQPTESVRLAPDVVLALVAEVRAARAALGRVEEAADELDAWDGHPSATLGGVSPGGCVRWALVGPEEPSSPTAASVDPDEPNGVHRGAQREQR